MMKLSIVTINYNNAEGLRKTLASVASQTYAEIEHIIIDGGSTDGSVEIIRQYADNQAKGERLEAKGTGNEVKGEENGEADTPASTLYTLHSTPTEISTPIYTNLHNSTPPKHRVLWVSEKDKGIYNAMNKGIEIALGRRIVNEDHTSAPLASSPHRLIASDYIQILNSGDILAAPDVTERMMAALAERNEKINNQQSEQFDNQQLKQLDNQQLKQSSGDIVNIVKDDIVGIVENTKSNQQSKQLDNQQLKQSTSDIVNIVENKIVGVVENKKSASPAIFYGNMIKEYPDGHRVKDTCGGADYTPESFLYFYKGTLNHDCAYIRKDLFEKYGLYNEQMKICSDWEWYVRAIALGGEKTSYTDIDVTVFDMMGISESGGKNRALIQQERREYLESILPASVLRDYDKYAFPIEQYQRLKKYHLWGLAHFIERVLFKLEKWGILGERLKVRG